MPELADYAAAVAPVVDAVHVEVHAAARPLGADFLQASGLTPGLLVDQRTTLPLRPLTAAGLAVVHRYGTAEEREPIIRAHLEEGTLRQDADGRLHATRKGLEFIDALYSFHARAAHRLWPDADLSVLAELAGRVLEEAMRDPGPALGVMAPPYEPEGATPGVLLFNRLATLRYHRADSHAAAWQAEGLTAAQMVALRPGPLRERIERDTNVRAAGPYRILSEQERAALLDGLLALVTRRAGG
ncbi:hypothetical protein [Thermoactinospora rubra]|uniref:hypothetical protein n=1 Tax=Thermoactinospora rubra TaxID=1088767 RepID=UPI000A0FA300|nr:hypothetical protein [Thermoactinospora rubra]